MADPLAGALAKLARAEEHLRCLQKEVGRWSEQRSDRMAREENDERTEFRFYTNWGAPPDPTRWGLILGDGIHNVRSTLDHIVYACSGSDPPERCEFPIFLSKDQYLLPETNRLGGLYKIRGVKNDTIRALIEGAQPWKNPKRPKYHLFWMVHELDIQDKHRLITPIAMVPRDLRGGLGVVELERKSDRLIEIVGHRWISLEDHALVMTVRTPEPAKRVEVNTSITFGIGVRVGDTHMGIQAVLGEACRAARGLLEQVRDALV